MTKTIAAIALASIAGVASAQNILVNAGFETGVLDPWYASNNNPFVTSDEAHSGTYSVAAFGSDEVRQDFAAIAATTITEVSVWIKRAGGPFDQYTFYYSDGSSVNHLLSGQGDDWQQFDLTSNLDLSKELTGFSIFGTSSGPAYMDDFVITPAPASIALMGLGGLAATRRRR